METQKKCSYFATCSGELLKRWGLTFSSNRNNVTSNTKARFRAGKGDSMQKQWSVTISAIVTAGLVQAQGMMGGGNNAWMKYQDKIMPIQDYSVTMVMEMGGQTMNTKTFQSGKKVRTEISMQGMQAISIIDPEADGGKGSAVTLMPMMKTYMKMPLPAEMATANKADAKEPDIKIEELGKEDVDGVSCDKRRITITADGKPQTLLVWASANAKNMPIKMEMKDPMPIVIKYKDYDFKKPAADLFTIPADYTAMKMGM